MFLQMRSFLLFTLIFSGEEIIDISQLKDKIKTEIHRVSDVIYVLLIKEELNNQFDFFSQDITVFNSDEQVIQEKIWHVYQEFSNFGCHVRNLNLKKGMTKIGIKIPILRTIKESPKIDSSQSFQNDFCYNFEFFGYFYAENTIKDKRDFFIKQELEIESRILKRIRFDCNSKILNAVKDINIEYCLFRIYKGVAWDYLHGINKTRNYTLDLGYYCIVVPANEYVDDDKSEMGFFLLMMVNDEFFICKTRPKYTGITVFEYIIGWLARKLHN
jgi:hypothetical protein